jgi:hypothetical protein
MKIKFILLFLSVILSGIPAISQEREVDVYGTTNGDSVNCQVYLSVFRQFYNLELYGDAIESWRTLFDRCPSSSEKMYIDGVNMYRSFIEEATDDQRKGELIDTLMLIYDRRVENFGGEGNVLGRKGRELLNYRGSDIDQVHEAYEMLKRSVELEGERSQEATMVLLINAGVTLTEADRIEDDEVIEDYFAISGILDQLEKRSSRWERTRATIDEIILNENLLTCEALNSFFEPKFDPNSDDKEFLEKVIRFYKSTGCDRSNLFVQAAEQLYSMEPSSESAHNLAIVFIAREDFEKAAEYLGMAVVGENIDNNTRAEWFYELALVNSAMDNYCEAISFAREAISYNDASGKAYILLGDAIIASRKILDDEFQQRAAFWAAVDNYSRAASVDPAVASEARQKINSYSSQGPGKEDVFFHDLKAGDSYHIGGCIDQTTTVKIPDE